MSRRILYAKTTEAIQSHILNNNNLNYIFVSADAENRLLRQQIKSIQ